MCVYYRLHQTVNICVLKITLKVIEHEILIYSTQMLFCLFRLLLLLALELCESHAYSLRQLEIFFRAIGDAFRFSAF